MTMVVVLSELSSTHHLCSCSCSHRLWVSSQVSDGPPGIDGSSGSGLLVGRG